MSAETEIEQVVLWCYCCEEFTPHEVYEDYEGMYGETSKEQALVTNTIYQCECGCQLDSDEDEIIKPDSKL